jgi:hypothetical protein
MKANGIIALLTDFGTSDWYVASMKAAALVANPTAQLIDITHAIEQGSISEGAFVLNRCFNDFPAGTTFVVVVDPGVGTQREAIVVRAGDYYFVGPNNGVLYPTISQSDTWDAYVIENPTWRGRKSSSTFHGRDLFAPTAGKIASGAPLEEAGRKIEALVPFQFPEPVSEDGYIRGEVIYFDRFGNGLTNFKPEHFQDSTLVGLRAADTLFPVAKTFGEVDEGDPVSYWGSSGFLEVAIRNGDAKANYKLQVGSRIDPIYQN